MEFLHRFYMNEYYLFQILIAELLFSLSLKHRNHFVWRVVGSLVVCCVASFFLLDYLDSIAQISQFLAYVVTFFLLFALTVAGMFVCFSSSPWAIIFAAIGAYFTQSIGNNFERIAVAYLTDPPEWEAALIMVSCYLATYLISYFLFARRLRANDVGNLNNPMLIVLSIVVVIVCFVLNFLAFRITEPLALVAMRCSLILSCFLGLSFQFGLLSQGQLQKEKETAETLIHEKAHQYEISKENMDLINIKCHDLKHQIHALGKEKSLDKTTIDDIANAVSIYNDTFNTGNVSLDVVLTEKSVFCSKNGITLNVIAEGSCLSFMSQSDIYSLFGNAIDNAIEAAKELPDPEMRLINLRVAKSNGIVTVKIENYYQHPVEMANGLPLTTKNDKAFHGYGTRSIQMLAEKYGGTVKFVPDKDIFSCYFAIPVPIANPE